MAKIATIAWQGFMSQHAKKLIIHGTTLEGRRFRPSDWAERLAGVMSQFRPKGSEGSHMTYSPYVVPRVIDGVRCVVVDHRLSDISTVAWRIVFDFAKDNDRQTSSDAQD